MTCILLIIVAGYGSSNGLSPEILEHVNLTSTSPSECTLNMIVWNNNLLERSLQFLGYFLENHL